MNNQQTTLDDSETQLRAMETHRAEFQRQLMFGTNDSKRIQELMARKSFQKLSLAKQSQMFRRHKTALSQANQAQTLLDQVNLKIEELSKSKD